MSTKVYTRTDQGDATTLQISGKLDVITASELKAEIENLVNEGRRHVTVDLQGLDLIDSSGVAAIVSLYKRVQRAGGKVKVTGARDQPLTIFKLLRMDRVFGF